MALIDFDKFLASFITEIKKNHMVITYNIPSCIKKALEDQGLEYKDGEIVKSQRRVSAEAKENGYGESDDERIRKAIHIYLDWLDGRNKDYQPKGDYSIKDMIAWLEKQGTPNQVSIWKHWKDGIAGNGEGKQIYLIKGGDSYILSSCLGYECDYIELSELDRLLEKQGEQKSAWSEEDEVRLQACIDTLQAKSIMGKVDTMHTNWLKSLKQRIGE